MSGENRGKIEDNFASFDLTSLLENDGPNRTPPDILDPERMRRARDSNWLGSDMFEDTP